MLGNAALFIDLHIHSSCEHITILVKVEKKVSLPQITQQSANCTRW